MSGKDLPLVKNNQIFMKPKLEGYQKWIKEKIEFQTNIVLSENIKKTENFNSSDKDEYKVPNDPYSLKKLPTTDEDSSSEDHPSPKRVKNKRTLF
jgi:hypothetical protein